MFNRQVISCEICPGETCLDGCALWYNIAGKKFVGHRYHIRPVYALQKEELDLANSQNI